MVQEMQKAQLDELQLRSFSAAVENYHHVTEITSGTRYSLVFYLWGLRA